VKRRQIRDRRFEGVAARIHGSVHQLILENQIPHDEIRIDLDGSLASGHPGEDEDAVGAQALHGLEGNPGCPGRLVDEVYVAHELAQSINRNVSGAHVSCTHGRHPQRLWVVGRLA
jgi:hypothetical protein